MQKRCFEQNIYHVWCKKSPVPPSKEAKKCLCPPLVSGQEKMCPPPTVNSGRSLMRKSTFMHYINHFGNNKVEGQTYLSLTNVNMSSSCLVVEGISSLRIVLWELSQQSSVHITNLSIYWSLLRYHILTWIYTLSEDYFPESFWNPKCHKRELS